MRPALLLVLLSSTAASAEADGGLSAPSCFFGYLQGAWPAADGFSSPTRPGSQEVRAMAAGRVESVDGGVLVEHWFYENARRRTARFVAQGLTRVVARPGQLVGPGALLGFGRRVRVEVDGAPPERFRQGRERLFLPGSEPALVLVDSVSGRAGLFERGALTRVLEVGFGQAAGAKERRGDLRTPQGMYFVTERSTGPFQGPYAAYYGGHWLKVNYPNAYDADRGLDAGWVDAASARAISLAWRRRALSPQRTPLGGGIGFHGWASEWEADGGTQLSWGCVVLHLRDVADFYARVPVGAMVVLLDERDCAP